MFLVHITTNFCSIVFSIQTTPVGFYGVPISDKILLQARAEEVLTIGKRFVDSSTYNNYLSRLSSESDEEVMQSFFETLAVLTSERQDECFQALVTELKYGHVVDRLMKVKYERMNVCVFLYSAHIMSYSGLQLY